MITEKEFNEAKARMEKMESVLDWSYRDLMLANTYIKQEALAKLDASLKDCPAVVREYVSDICRQFYGSKRTDEFLTNMKCFDEKMKIKYKGAKNEKID